jgi:hypothetical protein
MKKLLLVTFLLGLTVLACLPPALGYLARQQTKGQLQNLNGDDTPWQLQTLTEQFGWSQSNTDWQLRYHGAEPWQDTELTVHQEWHHLTPGPLTSSNNWAVLASELRASLDWPDQAALPLDGQVELGYDLGLVARIIWPQHRWQRGGLAWSLAPGELKLIGDLWQDDWQLTADTGAMSFASPGFNSQWQALALNAQRLSSGKLALKAAFNEWQSPFLQADALDMDWQASVNEDQLWQQTLQATMNDAQFTGRSDVSLEAAISLDDWHGPSVGALLATMGDINRSSLSEENRRNAQFAALLQHLPAIMQRRPAIRQLSLDSQSDLGRLRIDASLDLDDASELQLASPLMLEQAVNLRADVRISEDLLRWLLVERYLRQAGKWHQGPDDRPLYQRLAQDQIDTWMEMGWLKRDAGLLRAEIDLARGGWLINQKPWIRRS